MNGYQDDQTPERAVIEKKTNELLAELKQKFEYDCREEVIARHPRTGASVVPDLPDVDFLGPVDDDPTCGLLDEKE